MKTFTIFALFLLGMLQQTWAQCNAAASTFGNNSSVIMYNVQGAIDVVLNTNNTITVNLASNFATAAGPDVRIFLVDRGSLTTAQLKTPAMFNARPKIEMGMSPASGAASFTKAIPAGMTIADFETVYFFCQAFSQFWDFGSFTPFTTANCSVLETETFANQKLQLFPNPVNDALNINVATTTDYSVSIYNAVGSLIYKVDNQLAENTNQIDVNNLKTGIYFVKIIDSENKSYQKRFVKK